MKTEDNCFLAGKLWETWTVCWKAETLFCHQKPHSQCYGLPSGHIWLWELDHTEDRVPKNWCLWTLMLQKTSENPLESKETKPVNLKGNQPWIIIGRTDPEASSILVVWYKQPTHWRRLCCWERLRAEGEEDIRGWDGWMASTMQWTWTWANFRRWLGTDWPGMLQSRESQRVGTRLGNWTQQETWATLLEATK